MKITSACWYLHVKKNPGGGGDVHSQSVNFCHVQAFLQKNMFPVRKPADYRLVGEDNHGILVGKTGNRMGCLVKPV